MFGDCKMSTSAKITQLDTAKIFPRVAIQSGAIADLFGMLNAIYEGLIDASHPGASGGTQTFYGHDHGDEGGIGIINGCQLTLDGGNKAIFEKTNWAPPEAVSVIAWLGKFYISPGLKSTDLTFLEVAICYEAVGSDFDINSTGSPRSPNRSSDSIGTVAKVTGDGLYDWAFLQIPITKDKDWINLYLHIGPADLTAEPLEIRIFCVQVVETYNASALKRGSRQLQTAKSGETFLRYFGEELADELVIDDFSLNADTFKRLFSAINALAEATMDKPCPGASSQSINGHDHSALFLGRPIGHGKIYSAGVDLERYETSPAPEYIWRTAGAVVSTWYYADDDVSRRRTSAGSTPGGTVSTTPIFDAYVTIGISSSGDPPSAAPYLEGWIFVNADDASAALELRIYNQTTGTFSETIVPTINTWSYIRFIPCLGDFWNEFDIQVRHTSAPSGGNQIFVAGIVISEAYEYNGNKGAFVASSGSTILGVPRSGSTKVQVS